MAAPLRPASSRTGSRLRSLWLATGSPVDATTQDLFEEARDRPDQDLAGRELRVEVACAAFFAVAAAAFLVLLPDSRELSIPSAVLLTGLYALASRVEFLSGAGATVPTQLVLVPMLFVLPVPAVPLFVAAGLLLGRLPDYLRGTTPPRRAIVELGDALHALGPVLVLSLAGAGDPTLSDWPVYLAALAAQFAADLGFSTIRSRLGLGVPAGFALRELAWVCGIDGLLSCVGLTAALATREQDHAYLLVLPLIGLLAVSARDRRWRIEQSFELWQAYRGSVLLLDRVVEADDRLTGADGRGVVDLAMRVGDALGLDEAARTELEFAALLHDVGKIAIDNEIIDKRGPLTPEEFGAIKTHPIEGHRMLAELGGLLGRVGVIVRACHERWDGVGYPDGLSGHGIPLAARIVFACDAYRAMTTDRAYRRARSPERAIAELEANAGTQFDPAVVAALVEVVRAVPGAAGPPPAGLVPRAWAVPDSGAIAGDEAIIGFGPDGTVHSMNSAAVRLLGWAAEEAIGRRLHDLVQATYPNGEPYPPEASPIEAALRRGTSRADEVEVFWRRDGRALGVRYTIRPVVESGQHVGALLRFKPLVARSPAEEALRVGEELYRSLARNLHKAAVLLFDHDLRLLVAEGEPLSTVDLGHAELTGRRLRDVLPAAMWAELHQPARAALRGERRELEVPSEDGKRVYRLTVGPIRDDQGAIQAALAVAEDVTQTRHREERLDRLAHYDELTGLANRAAFHDLADRALRRAGRSDTRAALLFIDVDGLKAINDTRGHAAGDELLRGVGRRLRGTVREVDTIARLGGDEFAVLLDGVSEPDEVATAAERIRRAIALPLRVDGAHRAAVSASIGIAIQSAPDDTGAELLRAADAAMYRAKGLGGNRVQFYSPGSDLAASARRQTVRALADALDRDELVLHFQPSIDLESGEVAGIEALVRWHHPERGVLEPAAFLPEADRKGLIAAIDDWALAEACAQAVAWADEGMPVRIAVNLSPAFVRRDDLADAVRGRLDDAGLPADRLELELPEQLLADDDDATERRLRALQADGVRIVVDRFGTGRFPLGRLHSFPADALKIDRSFIEQLPDAPTMAEGVIELGHKIGLDVIAGGVETASQLELLRAHGCDHAIGHAIARPAPADIVTTWLLTRSVEDGLAAETGAAEEPGRRFERRRR